MITTRTPCGPPVYLPLPKPTQDTPVTIPDPRGTSLVTPAGLPVPLPQQPRSLPVTLLALSPQTSASTTPLTP